MSLKSEKKSLMSSLAEDLGNAYGSDSCATFVKSPITEKECMTDYQPLKLSSFRIFTFSRGSILANPILMSEQILITIVFFTCAAPVMYFFKEDAMGSEHSVRRFIREQENKMRAFAMIMTGLAAFLLSFYTSIIVGRWWAMRTNGVGAIKAATVDMHLLLYQLVTKEEHVLAAVQRYGRASLMLIFLWRQQDLNNMKQLMLKGNLLTEDECDLLLQCKHCLHETIWGWQTAIISSLYKQGKIKSDYLLALLLQKCTDGRAAAQCIHTHLAVRVPMQYVHLLGFLVKMHNMILSLIMGILFGAAVRNAYVILCIQLFARTLILPFLFNAILLINCDLADPFNGGETDFPGEIYQAAIANDCKGILATSQNVPGWLKEKESA